MRFELSAFADEAGAALDEQIAAMVENGIRYLEIRGVDGENMADISADKAKEIRRRLNDAGISVWSLGSPYGKIGIHDDFAPHLDKFRRGLELAHMLGAGHIRLFSFYVPKGAAETCRDAVMERLAQFARAARGSGIMLCHENEKGIYGDTAERCERIHLEFPAIRAVFDPANLIQCGENTMDAWRRLSPYVEYLHIKDARANGRVVPAGKGVGHIPEILSRYRGKVLTVEPHLSVFAGRNELERGQPSAMDEYRYPSSRAAFDAAVHALKELLQEDFQG